MVAVRPDGRIVALPPFGPRPVVKALVGNPMPTEAYDIDVEHDGGWLAL